MTILITGAAGFIGNNFCHKLAKNKKFYQVSGVSPSKDNQLLAYAEDVNGRREYTIKVKHLNSGKNLSDKISGTDGQFIWSKNSKNIFIFGINKNEKQFLGI